MLSPQHNLSDPQENEAMTYLFKQLEPFQRIKTYKKNEIVISSGQVSNKLVFIIQGILRTYRLNEDFDEVVSGFTFPGDFDLVSRSFFCRTPSVENIIAHTDVTLAIFHYKDIINILSSDPKLAQIAFAMLSDYIGTCEVRLFQMRNNNAIERYYQLREEQPEAIKEIPDHMLASYLGITKERISRIKNKLH